MLDLGSSQGNLLLLENQGRLGLRFHFNVQLKPSFSANSLSTSEQYFSRWLQTSVLFSGWRDLSNFEKLSFLLFLRLFLQNSKCYQKKIFYPILLHHYVITLGDTYYSVTLSVELLNIHLALASCSLVETCLNRPAYKSIFGKVGD